ncbi:Sua5/YciO/YrdC/YwlC family protein [Candidatus Micrarchaeota archaeon]|nr:Sua5/YciO/YrdC/YwlC family protein [Candidatus Micrarchaeota archaeon]
MSGKPSPTSWEHVLNDLNGRIPLILKGEDCEFGVESTIVNCLGKTPILLRPGAVPVEDIERIIGKVRVPRKFKKALSPGMAYRHYAPVARVVLVKSVAETPSSKGKWAFIGFDDCEKALFKAKPKDSREYARLVFDFLRDSDALGIEVIYAQLPENKGFGRALLDRLKRSALK